MPEPPRDASGAVIPHDDPSISDDDFVVRYIPHEQLTPDGSDVQITVDDAGWFIL